MLIQFFIGLEPSLGRYLETLLADRIANLFWRLKRVAPDEAAEAAKLSDEE